MSKSQQLVALVTLLCHVDGKRVSFAPGDEITVELPAHDLKQLIRQGSVRNVTAEAAAAERNKEQERAQSAAFLEARSSVMSEQAAVSAAPAPAAPADAAPADAAPADAAPADPKPGKKAKPA